MPYFAESPFTRIVDVHWKKKKPDDGSPGDNPPYCGRYGWGEIVVAEGGYRGPYGPNQFIPFVGTYSTRKHDPVYGGLISDSPMRSPVDSMTAPAPGTGQFPANSILLAMTGMGISNSQIAGIINWEGQMGHFYWSVPMASGQSPDSKSMVVKSYTITVEYTSAYDEPNSMFGLGLSHPIKGEVHAPPKPLLIVGSFAHGAASYTYDYKVKETMNYENIPNESNQFDPGLGGDAFLWWMETRPGLLPPDELTWSANPDFMDRTLNGVGDYYFWSIVANCEPMPNLFG